MFVEVGRKGQDLFIGLLCLLPLKGQWFALPKKGRFIIQTESGGRDCLDGLFKMLMKGDNAWHCGKKPYL